MWWTDAYRRGRRSALIAAFAISAATHALVLWAPGPDPGGEEEAQPLLARLRPPVLSQPVAAPVEAAPLAVPPRRSRPVRPKAAPAVIPDAAMPDARADALPAALPQPETVAAMPPPVDPPPADDRGIPPVESGQVAASGGDAGGGDALPDSIPAVAPIGERLSGRGLIRFRVERGDRGFVVGQSEHRWEIDDGRYALTAISETSGLAALLKSVRVVHESRGSVTPGGLRPEYFSIARSGRATDEVVQFDWEQGLLRFGEAAVQPAPPGAQDLLSFHYQIGLLPHLEAGYTLPVATGRKLDSYRFEAVGEELIEVPAGSFRTLHLKVSGTTTTELWLAYDAALLPVKIRHVDRKGESFVQVATQLQFSQEE